MAKKQFRVDITTKGSFEVEVAPIDTDEYEIDSISPDDFEDLIYDSDYICMCALGDEWEGQFNLKVCDENNEEVFESDDFTEFLFICETEQTEDEDFPSCFDKKKVAEELEKRWSKDAENNIATGIYAVRRHEIKWITFNFVIEDEKFDPKKLLFVANNKLSGLVYDEMTDPNHIFYENKFVESEIDEDYDEYGSYDFIMEKNENWWKEIREID